jgi:hypothetical protein
MMESDLVIAAMAEEISLAHKKLIRIKQTLQELINAIPDTSELYNLTLYETKARAELVLKEINKWDTI